MLLGTLLGVKMGTITSGQERYGSWAQEIVRELPEEARTISRNLASCGIFDEGPIEIFNAERVTVELNKVTMPGVFTPER